MRYLLNSAVIAAGAYGDYRYAPATIDELREFVLAEELESRIGYAETAALIERWTGWRPPLSRELSALAPGDHAMVVRLKRRLADPTTKGAPTGTSEDDWEVGHLMRLMRLTDQTGLPGLAAFRVNAAIMRKDLDAARAAIEAARERMRALALATGV